MLKPYGLEQTEGCELTRIALTSHAAPVSRIVSLAVKLLKQIAPKLRLIISYADPNQGHNGAIYQAGGWAFVGQTGIDAKYIDSKGRAWHSRQVSSTGVKRQYGEARRVPKHSECTAVPLMGKFRYLMPLDAEMKAQIEPLRKPYPKRAGSADSGTSANHAGGGGAIPTSALQIDTE